MRMSEAFRHRAALWHVQVAKLLRDAMPDEGLAAPPDGELAVEVPVFHVATQVGRLPSVRAALREAEKDLPPAHLPLAVVKDNNNPQALAVMPFDKFLLLVSAWWAATQPAVPAHACVQARSQEVEMSDVG